MGAASIIFREMGPDILMLAVPGFLLSKAQSGTLCGFSRSDCNTPLRRKLILGDGPWGFYT